MNFKKYYKFSMRKKNKNFLSVAVASFVVLGTTMGGQVGYANDQEKNNAGNTVTKEDNAVTSKLDALAESKENNSTQEIPKELLKSGKDINKLYIQKGEKSGSINEIYALAKQRKVVIVELEKVKFAKMAQTPRAQGVIAVVPPYEYVSVDDILDYAKSKNEKPFILILDEIEDPHNLGSIIRTAECTGVHGIIIPKRRSAMVNSTVFKTSVGAAEYVNVAVVRNLNDTINYLKENGAKIISLGKRILRAETAAIVTGGVIINEFF